MLHQLKVEVFLFFIILFYFIFLSLYILDPANYIMSDLINVCF